MTGLKNGQAIEVLEIGKRYSLGATPGAGSLRDQAGKILGRRSQRDLGTIWALRDVSFSVPTGRVVGIMGNNGSGKTTLMRILARVTAPTEGSARIWGRVGALFQVGTGFHPELTGRENVTLSGAFLGMEPERTQSAFDDIVAFADIGDYLDVPVKHYSSGMYVRLAFAVSAHLDADILLIDEALSVGDATFKEKCQNRIRELVRGGRTVVLVTHDAEAIQELCDSAIVFHHGRLLFDGDTDDAIDFYARLIGTTAAKLLGDTPAADT